MEDPSSDLVLEYQQPAQEWQSEALPIGNGRLGAMIFGGVAHEHIQLNESSLWTGDEQQIGDYQSLGDLHITLQPPHAHTHYRRRLDLRSALHTIDYTSGGVNYHRDYFASHPGQVLVFRFTAEQPSGLTFSINFKDAHGWPSYTSSGRITCPGTLPNGLAFETQIAVNSVGGLVAAEEQALRIIAADEVTVFVAARTNYHNSRVTGWRTNPPHEKVNQDIERARADSFETLLCSHSADYDRLFSRVKFAIHPSDSSGADDPIDKRLQRYGQGINDFGLEALLFQYGRYLLICSSRNALPANLQGLWNQSNSPPWHCDYHSNINLQMNYWPAEVCNLSECTAPLFEYIQSIREVRIAHTQAYYGLVKEPSGKPGRPIRGWTLQTEGNIFGAGSFKWNPPASAWLCLHLWEHYQHTLDRTFLQEVAYPLLKETCEFWEDHLIALPDGRLATPDGWSPEHGPEEPGVTYDQAIVAALFHSYISAAQALQCDVPFRKNIQALQARLVSPAVGRWGQLQEWMEDLDDPADRHRHVSHLFGLFPAHLITLEGEPELARAARVSLEARGDESTGWAIVWRIACWARLREGDRCYLLLRRFLREVSASTALNYEAGGGVYANLLCAHPPFQIDGNLGIAAAISEVLVQSHEGIVHLLPALPSAWTDGQITGLRVRGGFEVGITWSDGQLKYATISSVSTSTARLRYQRDVRYVNIVAGSVVRVDRNLNVI